MRLSKMAATPPPVCNREHYSCPSYHKWDLEKTFSWAFSIIGTLAVLALVTAFFIWMYPGFFHTSSPAVEAAKIQRQQAQDQIDAKEKADFTAVCAKQGKYPYEYGSADQKCQ